MKLFVFDASVCNGCYNCQIACKDEHCGNDWTPYAKPQPDTGQFWLRLSEHVRGTVPKVKVHYLVSLCNHCDEPACLKACAAERAIFKRDDGLVIIDPERCTGCTNCVSACPYHAVHMNDELRIAQKCTGCAHLLDAGWDEPRCVDACPTGAFKFLDESEAGELMACAEVLRPDKDLKPRVHYRNIPKRFIAGTVYDPVKKEVIRGAECRLSPEGGEAAGRSAAGLTVRTDGFGDFWFHDLDVGTYSLEIRGDEVRSRTFAGLNTERDVNLGDIPLD